MRPTDDAKGATATLVAVTLARLPPFATRLALKVAAFVPEIAVLRAFAPLAALVLEAVGTRNRTETVSRREADTMVTSALVH